MRYIKFLSVFWLFVFIIMPVSVHADYAPALLTPELTGNQKNDIINVAISQLGYKENKAGETIYAAWAGQAGRDWCSEFVAWCADQAQIPTSIIPLGTSTDVYRRFFGAQGRFYLVDNGHKNEKCGCKSYACGTISWKDIQPGDILLVETNGHFSDGPDHSCLAVKKKKKYIKAIDGNKKNRVTYSKRKRKVIHGVCRPLYATNAGEVLFNTDEVTVLTPGNTFQAEIVQRDVEDAVIAWNTSDPEVAEVSDGKVTALSAGAVTITASLSSGKAGSFVVIVQDISVGEME